VGGEGMRDNYYHSWIKVVDINTIATKVPVNENATIIKAAI